MSDAGLPSGWEVRHSNSKNLPYFFNASSKESRWEPPEGTDVDKLKAYMAQNTRKPEGKIHAAHLLIKHRDSRRPGSWKEPTITRTKEEAIEILKGHERRIKSGEISLGGLAQTESDCSSARKNGDLGIFGKGEMQKEFEEVAFALEPGQVSGVVDTASGVHLIQRLE
ncbi:peptidyl-prolyl cis-trans isomerase Pin1 [Xanthoria parietina]